MTHDTLFEVGHVLGPSKPKPVVANIASHPHPFHRTWPLRQFWDPGKSGHIAGATNYLADHGWLSSSS